MPDPLANVSSDVTPYRYAYNNPLFFTDPEGLLESTHTDSLGNVIAVYNDNDLSVYRHNDAKTKADVDKKRKETGSTSGGGEKEGETYFWDEFRPGDRILFNQSWNTELIDLAVDGSSEGRIPLMFNSRSGNKFDIKSRYYLGKGGYAGKLLNGKYISAESAGNFLAGFNASGRGELSFVKYMQLAGAYHKAGMMGVINNERTGKLYGVSPWYGEIAYAGRMILWGWLTKSPGDEEAGIINYIYYHEDNK